MGNIDGRAHFDGGYIYVKTHKQFYYPGEKVFGKIYLRTEKVLNAKFLEIRVKGKEKSSFWYTQGSGDDSSRRKHKNSKTHMDCKFTAFQF